MWILPSQKKQAKVKTSSSIIFLENPGTSNPQQGTSNARDEHKQEKAIPMTSTLSEQDQSTTKEQDVAAIDTTTKEKNLVK
ncbi:hypothetical protein V6N13_015193 [Hibiscus sabdariffa]